MAFTADSGVVVFANRQNINGTYNLYFKKINVGGLITAWSWPNWVSNTFIINSICSDSSASLIQMFRNDSLLFIDPMSGGVLFQSYFPQQGLDVLPLYSGGYLMKSDSTVKKIDQGGNLVWTVGGVSVSSYDQSNVYVADTADIISKIDILNGNTLWSVLSPDTSISALCAISYGGVAGVTANQQYLQPHSMFRIDSTGIILWNRSYTSAVVGFDAIMETPDKGILTGGTSFTSNAFFYSPQVWDINNYYASFLVKADSLGYGPEKVSNVWIGDVNNDLVFDAVDGLYLSLAIGASGEERPGKGIQALIQPWGDMRPSVDWPMQFPNGVNIKTADCNGDGFITIADAANVTGNGSTHPNWRNGYHQSFYGNFCLEYAVSSDTVAPGQSFQIYVIAGTSLAPIDTVYAFYIHPDIPNLSLINPPLCSFDIYPGDFGTSGVSCISFKAGTSTVFGVGNDYFVTRNNQQNVTQLHDTIAVFNLVAASPVWTSGTFEMNFLDGMSITYDGKLYQLISCTPSVSVVVDPNITGAEENVENILDFHPNPSSGIVFTNTVYMNRQFTIIDVTGREVYSTTLPAGEKHLDLSILQDGIYFLKVEENGKNGLGKIMILHE
jgi:Secretion system C-terminal sorting domain